MILPARGRLHPSSSAPTGAEVRVTLDLATTARRQGFGRIADRTATRLVALDASPRALAAAALVFRGHGVRALVPLHRSLEDVFVDLVGVTTEGEGR